VAYGMSRLYWSNLPDAKRPRGGTSGLWSSLTTADLPIRSIRKRAPTPVCRRLRRGRRRRAASRFRMLARTISRERAAGPACRVRQAGTRRCDAGFPIQPDSAGDHSQRRRRLIALLSVLASSFIMIAETGPGTLGNRSLGGTGCLAMWQSTQSIGSEAMKGRLPVSIS